MGASHLLDALSVLPVLLHRAGVGVARAACKPPHLCKAVRHEDKHAHRRSPYIDSTIGPDRYILEQQNRQNYYSIRFFLPLSWPRAVRGKARWVAERQAARIMPPTYWSWSIDALVFHPIAAQVGLVVGNDFGWTPNVMTCVCILLKMVALKLLYSGRVLPAYAVLFCEVRPKMSSTCSL